VFMVMFMVILFSTHHPFLFVSMVMLFMVILFCTNHPFFVCVYGVVV